MNSARFSRLYVFAVTATWVTVVIGLMLINLRQIHEAQYAMATNDAREHVNEDNAFRFWVASMGGGYAPVTDRIQPNANLSHIPERDIKTPTGKSLTLINSAYLLRLIMTDYADLYGIRGHLAGLTPSRKETAPDEWEKAALLKFQDGIPEISKVATINGVPYVRLMKPMYVKEQCLECHTHQNYTVGNVAGGVSVAVPLDPYLARMQKEMIFCTACYGIVLVFGLAGILLGRNRLIHHVEERDKTENALRERTAELVKVNADLRIEVEERKRAEDAFRESEATLRQIIDLVPHMIFVKDWDGKYLLVNKAVAEANNMSVSDLTGKYQADLHSDSSELQNMLQDDRAVMMTGETKFIPEESYTDAQGNLRFHQATKVPFHIFGDKKPAVLGVAIDITKSKQAEEALHESERRLRTILHTANEGFWLIDNDTLTIDLNPRMCAIMGRNRDEVLGRKIFDFVDNENKAIFEQQVRLREQGLPGAYEIAFCRPDGSLVFCQFNVTPFFDGSGNKIGAFAMVTDISERKRAEDALRDNEEKFRSIFDNSLEGILFSAPDGSIFAANRAACEMLGRSEREICEGGRDLVVDMTDPRLQKCLEERKRTGRFLGELNHRRKDGTAFPVEISTSQFSLTNGDLRACIIFRDITERKRMEKSVLESEQRFRMIAETIRDVFWITTPDARRMVYVSPACEPLWGRSCESLYQAPTSFLEAVHPDDQQTLVAHLKGCPEGNWDCEYRIIQQDGGIRWIHARGFPVRNEANEITRMIGIASDITRRK